MDGLLLRTTLFHPLWLDYNVVIFVNPPVPILCNENYNVIVFSNDVPFVEQEVPKQETGGISVLY